MEKIINAIKKNKRVLYLVVTFILFLFCMALNFTFSAFTYNSNEEAVNISVGTLNYTTTIDGTVKTSVTASSNAITRTNIILNSPNQINTKYEVIYEIYSDAELTTKVSSVEGLTVEYSSKSTDSVTGTINSGASKSFRLIIINNTNTTYYLKIGINAGFTHNPLSLKGLISNEFAEDDLAIVTYVNGTKQNDFPTTSEYNTTVECKDAMGNAIATTGTVTWTNDAWVLSLSNIDESEIKCSVYFSDKL